jgi:peptidoglycan hydrolase-like protein with peptidoglycan-binding domain
VGRNLAKRQKTVIDQDKGLRVRFLGTALPCLCVALAGMTVFNAFFGHPGAGRKGDASANMTASIAPSATQHTVILKYDETVEDVQRELLTAGLFIGLVDGVDGPQTKVAVENYQRANQLDINGTVSASLLEHIRYTKKLAMAAKFTGSIAPITKPEKSRVVVPTPALKPVAAAPVQTGGFVDLQKRLAKLGYDPGTRSGELDEATRSAILIFEMDHGLAMEGKVTKAFLAAMKQAETQLSSSN